MDEVIATPSAAPATKSVAPPRPSAARSAALSRPWRPGFLCRTWHLWTLLAITVLGGALRFYHLERPPIWYDEAATFSRVTGTWDQMFDQLKTDGFMPLHYVIAWWIGQKWYLTPFMLRLGPALAGTLLVPAMYFLARQMVGKKPALLAAAFAACSAYMLAFSRDAKMYMETWFFMTLHMGLLLWWLRSKSWWGFHLIWPLWVLAGAAAAWFHATALLVLAVGLLAVITGFRRPWWRMELTVAAFIVGALLIAAGPFWYYTYFNKWNERSGGVVPEVIAVDESRQRPPNWNDSGLDWVAKFQRQRTPPEIVRHTASAFLLGWEWPDSAEESEKNSAGEFVIPRWTIQLGSGLMALFAVLCVLGALPWPARWRATGGSGGDPPPQPWWRIAFWLSAWLILPAYSLYCQSVVGFVPPAYWVGAVGSLWGKAWWLFIPGMVAVAVALTIWKRFLPYVLTAVGLIALPLVVQVSLTHGGIGWFDFLVGFALKPWVLALITLLLPPLAWYYAGATTRQRLRRLLQAALVAGAVLALCWLVYRFWLGKFTATPPGQWHMVWWPRYLAVLWPALAIAVAVLIMRLPTRPLRYAAIVVLLGANVVNGMARVVLTTDPPWDRIGADVYAGAQKDSDTRVAHYDLAVGWERSLPPERRGFASAGLGGGTRPRRPEGLYGYVLAGRITPQPMDFRLEKLRDKLAPIVNRPGNQVIDEAGRNVKITRLVVWERHPAGPEPKAPASDPYLARLGPGWQIKTQEVWHLRQHWSRMSREWNWQQREWLRRVEYVRVPPATTRAS